MKISRRSFLKQAGTVALLSSGCVHSAPRARGFLVNDVQSRLNPTQVVGIVRVGSLTQLQSAVKAAAERGKPISICGGRHAMGGQQFLTNGTLLDTIGLRRVVKFDRERGVIEVEAGMQWPGLLK